MSSFFALKSEPPNHEASLVCRWFFEYHQFNKNIPNNAENSQLDKNGSLAYLLVDMSSESDPANYGTLPHHKPYPASSPNKPFMFSRSTLMNFCLDLCNLKKSHHLSLFVRLFPINLPLGDLGRLRRQVLNHWLCGTVQNEEVQPVLLAMPAAVYYVRAQEHTVCC